MLKKTGNTVTKSYTLHSDLPAVNIFPLYMYF